MVDLEEEMNQTPETIETLFDAMKFPTGIKYCDWEKLTQEEKEQLWENYERTKTTSTQ